MTFKEFELDDFKLKVIKNKKNRRLRLSITGSEVKVSIPYYISYQEGLKFAKSKKDWIKTKLKPKNIFIDSMKIGKNHTLRLEPCNVTRPSCRINDILISIKYPLNSDIANLDLQHYIEKQINQALKKQAQVLIPKRTSYLAHRYGFDYQSVTIKSLKTRWGSCDRNKNLTFNLKIMNLDWELIDYIILHELTHTLHMHHQEPFWNEMLKINPKAQTLRLKLKKY